MTCLPDILLLTQAPVIVVWFDGIIINVYVITTLLVMLVAVAVVSHIQCIDCQPEKTTFYTVDNLARGLLNREKKNKENVWQRTSPPPPAR